MGVTVRMDAALARELRRWATEEARSLKGQLDTVVREALKARQAQQEVA